jgi:DNA-binding PadR family transcriptional regulator
VRVALLMLLSVEHPLNGYQLMQGLEERSDGRWRPSPGSVYPALQQLEDEGLIHSVQSEGESGRAFELTDKGREHLAERGDQKAPWEPDANEDGNPRARFRQTIGGLARTAAHVFHDGTPEQVEEALQILEEARKKLYRLLAGDE